MEKCNACIEQTQARDKKRAEKITATVRQIVCHMLHQKVKSTGGKSIDNIEAAISKIRQAPVQRR